MARVLILVTRPGTSGTRLEWRNDWWENVIRMDMDKYAVCLFGITANSTDYDVLYAEDRQGSFTELRKTRVNAGMDYYLMSSADTLDLVFKTRQRASIPNRDRIVVIIRGDSVEPDTVVANIKMAVVNKTFATFQWCLARHSEPLHLDLPFVFYSSTDRQFWANLMRLKYGGSRNESLRDRIAAFEQVWQNLYCRVPPEGLEAYFEIMLNLSFDNYEAIEEWLIRPQENTVIGPGQPATMQSIWATLPEDIRMVIEEWNVSYCDKGLQNLNNKYFKFVEHELKRYCLLLGELE